MFPLQPTLVLFAWAASVPAVVADTPPRSSIQFSSISSGVSHTCALTSDGTAYCWGLNNSGELGGPSKDTCKAEHGENLCSKRPIAVSGSLRFLALVVGQFHSCGLSNEGRAYCWGSDYNGQLGADSGLTVCHEPNGNPLKCASIPVPVAGGFRFALLVAGRLHNCGLTTTGVTYCWGLDEAGQLGSDSASGICGEAGEGGHPCHRTPVRVGGERTLVSLAAGRSHTCGLDAQGQAWCWGRFLGAPLSPIGAHPPFASISAGDHKTCALTPEGATLCWGVFRIGPSDLLMTLTTPTPGGTWQAADDSALHFTSVTIGEEHICGLTSARAAYCWGVGWAGNLGISRGLFKLGKQGSNDPLPVEGKLQFAVLSAGFAYTCGVSSDGRAFCWGENKLGQLGDGTTKGHDQPKPVVEPL